jgi:hypothetical protein
VTIPISLGIWAITGVSVVEAGIQLGHAGLTNWGIILTVASLIGAAAGMLLAAHRGPVRRQPRQPSRATQPARPSERAGAHARKEKEVMPIT